MITAYKPNEYRYFYAALMAITALLMRLSSDFYIEQLPSKQNAVPFVSIWVFAATSLAYLIPALHPVLDVAGKKMCFTGKTNILIPVSLLLVVALFLLDLPGFIITQYGAVSLLTVLYYTGIKGRSWHFRGMRTLLIWKNILLSMAWALLTSPIVPDYSTSYLLFANRFLLLFSLSILIDIRDIRSDRDGKTKTIPAVAGIPMTKLLAGILLTTGTSFIYQFQRVEHDHTMLFLVSLISTLFILATFPFLQQETSKIKFLLLIDGNLFLNGLLFFIATH